MHSEELFDVGSHHLWVPPDDFGSQRQTPRGQYQVVVVNCVSGMETTPLPDRQRWQLSRRTMRDDLDPEMVGELGRLASDKQQVTCFVDVSADGARILSPPTRLEWLESAEGALLAAIALDDSQHRPIPLTSLPQPIAEAITTQSMTTLRGAVAAQILCRWTAQSFCSCGGRLARQPGAEELVSLKHGDGCAIGEAASRVHLASATAGLDELGWWIGVLAWAFEPLLHVGWLAGPFDIRPDFDDVPEWLKGQPLLVRLVFHRDQDRLTVWYDPGNGEVIISGTGPQFAGESALNDHLLVEGIDLTPERVLDLVDMG